MQFIFHLQQIETYIVATPKNFGAPEFNDSESDSSAGHNEFYDDNEEQDTHEKDEKQDTKKKERILITEIFEDPDNKNFWLTLSGLGYLML